MFFYRMKINSLFLLFLSMGLLSCDNQTAKESFPPPKKNINAAIIPSVKWTPPSSMAVKFPVDDALHNALQEWIYHAGRIETIDGKHYSILFIIIQIARSGMPVAYIANFGITDVAANKFKYEESFILKDPKQVKFGGINGFNLNIDGWQVSGSNGMGSLRAVMHDGSYGLNILFHDVRGIVVPFGGLLNYGTTIPELLYYFERPRMEITGTISVNHQVKIIKKGELWFEHQWGDFFVASNWVWFYGQLNDGSDVMLGKLYSPKNSQTFSRGVYIPPCQGPCIPNRILKSITLTEKDFSLKANNFWKSPKTNITYPINWDVMIKSSLEVPNLLLNFQPVLNDAEMIHLDEKLAPYWEGDNYISGTKDGKPIAGAGYLELVGFDGNESKAAKK